MIELQNSLASPAISVIMSVKNGMNDLHKSIESILNQTFSNFEFIICDDGSTDDTMKILESYKQKDNRIILIHNNVSKGLAYSLNKCIEVSRSNILVRQDADDTSELNRFEVQYEFVQSHPQYAIVGTSWNNVNEDGEILKVRYPLAEPTAMDQVRGGSYMHPSWMMRKNMLQEVGFYTVNEYTIRNQDYHLVMKILGAGMKLYNIKDVLYNYKVDNNMIARTHNWKRVKGLIWILYDSYRRNHMPLWCYIYTIKPLIIHIIPMFILNKYYKHILTK